MKKIVFFMLFLFMIISNFSPAVSSSGAEAEKLLHSKKYKEALEAVNHALGKDSRNPSLYVLRGDILFRCNEYSHAISDYQKALSLNPTLCSAGVKLGKAYERQGEFSLAKSEYDRILSRYPLYSDAWLARGELMLSRGAFDNAIADFNMALRTNPKNSMASLGRGLARMKSGAVKTAIFDFDVIIMTYDGIPLGTKVGDFLPLAYYYRGIAYEKLDKEDIMRGANYGYSRKAAESFRAFLLCYPPENSEKEILYAKNYLYTPEKIKSAVKTNVVKVELEGSNNLLLTMQVDNGTDRTVSSVGVVKFDLYLDSEVIGRKNVVFEPRNNKMIPPGESGFLYLRLYGDGRDFRNWSVTIFETIINTL